MSAEGWRSLPAGAWEEADAEAHETKAEALESARDVLRGVLPIMDTVGGPMVSSAIAALEAHRARHEESAVKLRAAVKSRAA